MNICKAQMQAIRYEWMNDALHKIKRERESWEILDQTQTQGYVSRFEPLALHPRLHHREGFPIHYRSTKLLSQPYNLQWGNTTTTLPLPKRDKARSQQTQSPLPKRDPNTTSINLYQRGIHKYKEGLQQVVYLNHKPLSFFHKQYDPNRIG